MWKKYKDLIFPILILVGIIYTIWFFNKNEFSQEEFFNQAVTNSYNESYSGIVTDKYYDKYNHGRDIIVIEKDGIELKLDYVEQKQGLYDFLNLGDSIEKKKSSNSIQVKRNSLDTIIILRFENIKGFEIYSEKNKMLGN